MKCNLQYPCSKCSSRGKECIFINDPEASRNKRNAAKKAAAAKATAEASSVPPPDQAVLSPPYPSLFVPIDGTPSPTLPLDGQLLPALDLPDLSTSPRSSVASTRSSPRSELLEHSGDFTQPFDVATFDTLTLDNQLSQFFPGTPCSFDGLGLDQSISSCPPQSTLIQDFSWLDGCDSFSKCGPGDIYSYSRDIRMEGQNFLPGYVVSMPPTSLNSSPSRISPRMSLSRAFFDSPAMINPHEPTAEDLEHYCMFIFL